MQISPQDTPAPAAIGESEHDKQMIAIGEGEPQQTAPEETPSPERPEWLPEKFNSAEDMAKAYSELEKKLGQPSEEPKAEEPKAEESKAEDYQKYTDEYIKDGKLSEESYAELAAKGFSKDMVDVQLQGLQQQIDSNQPKLSQEQADSIINSVGGQENFEAVVNWASQSADQALVAAYDQAIASGNSVVAASLLTTIATAYTEATGSEGNRVSGVPSKVTGDTFETWAQVEAAMNDPRYYGRQQDTAYVKEVQEKISRSKNL